MSFKQFLNYYYSIDVKDAGEDEVIAFAEYCERTDNHKKHNNLRDLGEYRSHWNTYVSDYE